MGRGQNMNNETKRGRPLGASAADVFLWLLLLLCIAAVAVRIVLGEGGGIALTRQENYLLSYSAAGVRGEYSDAFSDGTEYYLEDGTYFGKLTGEAVLTPMREYLENSHGVYVVSYRSDGRMDVKGAAQVRGAMTERGFLLGGETYIAPNMRLTLYSATATVEILVTDITGVAAQN